MGKGAWGGPRRTFFQESSWPLLCWAVFRASGVAAPGRPGLVRIGTRGGIRVVWRDERCSSWGHLDPSWAVFPEYFCLVFFGIEHKVQPPGLHGAHQVHRPLSCRPPSIHWRAALGGGGAAGPGDCHLHGWLGCLSSLGLIRGQDRCWAQLPNGTPLRAWPGLALIDYTGASAWAQVAGPGQPLAPSRHGLAGDRGMRKKEGTGWGRL